MLHPLGGQVRVQADDDGVPDKTVGVEHLERDFSDLILPGGRMVQSGPLPDEADEPHLDRLPRLIFPIKRGNYGKLRLLIDRINQTPSRTYSPPSHV